MADSSDTGSWDCSNKSSKPFSNGAARIPFMDHKQNRTRARTLVSFWVSDKISKDLKGFRNTSPKIHHAFLALLNSHSTTVFDHCDWLMATSPWLPPNLPRHFDQHVGRWFCSSRASGNQVESTLHRNILQQHA